MTANTKIKGFSLKLFKGSGRQGEPELAYQGSGQEWQQYQDLVLPGFSGAVCISLRDAWRYALENRLPCYQTQVTGYETIVKFGDAMQLKTPFTVEIRLNR